MLPGNEVCHDIQMILVKEGSNKNSTEKFQECSGTFIVPSMCSGIDIYNSPHVNFEKTKNNMIKKVNILKLLVFKIFIISIINLY